MLFLGMVPYRCTVARMFGKTGEWSFSGCFLKSRLSKGAISISPFRKSFIKLCIMQDIYL